METNILLESGTNELEILEFSIGNQFYGINVAKIKEIIAYTQPTPVPNAHPSIEGIIMPRNEMITIINLFHCLNIQHNQIGNEMLLITNFNNLHVGFHVSSVLGIHRVSWESIKKPELTLTNSGGQCATGIVKVNEKLIIILDFEKIVADVCPETTLKISDVKALGKRNRNECPILIAEDSPMLFALLKDCLVQAGFTNLKLTSNGKEALELLEQINKDPNQKEKIQMVITDIEMPQMDGLHLTKRIKDDYELKDIPVIVFSSLVNDEMKRKCIALGANAQISKPEISELVKLMDEYFCTTDVVL